MVDVPIGAVFTLVKEGTRLGLKAHRQRKAAKDTAKLIGQALMHALAPSRLRQGDDEVLARALGEALAETPLDPVDSPSGLRKLAPKPFRRKLPSAGVVTGVPFSERLESWLGRAFESAHVQDVLDGVDRSRVEPAKVVRLFPIAFRGLLVDSRSEFDRELARELWASDKFRAWAEDQRRRFADTFTGAGAAGATALGLAELANLPDSGVVGLAVAAAASLAGFAWRASSPQPRVTELQVAARQIAFEWLADLVRDARGEVAQDPIDETVTLYAGLDALGAGGNDALAQVAERFIDELARRVLPVAREAKDERLVAELRRVEYALLRACRNYRVSPVPALAGLLDAISAEGRVE